jgi:serine/threonine protein kinase
MFHPCWALHACVRTRLVGPLRACRYDFKVLAPAPSADQRLELDVAQAAAAGHAHDYKLYLVQERCSSNLADTLEEGILRLTGGRAPPLDVSVGLLLDVASGVAHLHSRSIIHADLKPDNIMLKVDRNSSLSIVAKLTDFGLATVLDPTATHVSNYRAGTTFYMAPEVLAHGRATLAADIYSFGVIMWSMFTGEDPWLVLEQVRCPLLL